MFLNRLAVAAFHQVLGRKQAAYKEVNKWLQVIMQRLLRQRDSRRQILILLGNRPHIKPRVYSRLCKRTAQQYQIRRTMGVGEGDEVQQEGTRYVKGTDEMKC
jgi:hypothetical protein